MRALATLILLTGLLVTGLLAGPARADETASALPESDQQAIHGVIQGQMDAFRHDQAAAAFAFASPNIQAMFGSPEAFLDMVRQGYAPVYHPSSVRFGPLVDIDGAPVQKVEVVGPNGERDLALYYMQRDDTGTWRISGCVLTHGESVGA